MELNKLKYNIDNEVGDYYENIVNYIYALIQNDQKDEAFLLLKEELNQPYVPAKTLDSLEEIFETYYVVEALSKQITIEEAKKALEEYDIENVVANFFTLNLRLLEDEIIDYLANCSDYVSSSILLYTLIDQKVAIDFEITKFGQTKVFSSLDLQIVDEEILLKYNELFELRFVKDPSFIKYCNEILNYYMLVTFPFKFDSDFDLFEEIVNYVFKTTGQNVVVNNDFLQIIEHDIN